MRDDLRSRVTRDGRLARSSRHAAQVADPWTGHGMPAGLAHRCDRRQNACMPKSITIRDVPDDTSAELASRAALSGRSLQEYLRSRLIELADRPDVEVWLSGVRARKAATGTSISADRILAHREADRR